MILIKLQNHIRFIGPYHKGIVNIYGISQDPNTKEYVLVMRYAAEGDFKKYLKSNYTGWNNKIKKLYNIISSLNILHQEKLIHGDLHSGNILYFKYLSQFDCIPSIASLQKLIISKISFAIGLFSGSASMHLYANLI